jgi:hypothetical protein
MKKLEIRESKVDFNKIIEMNLKKQDWGKKYTLYTSGSLTINIEMIRYDFSRDVATFDIRGEYKYNNKTKLINTSVEYFNKNFSVKEFKKLVERRVVSELKLSKRVIVRMKANVELASLSVDGECNSEFFEEYGNIDDYNAIKGMGSEFEYDLISRLFEEVEWKANEPYRDAVNAYVNNNKISIQDVDKLIDKLEESK